MLADQYRGDLCKSWPRAAAVTVALPDPQFANGSVANASVTGCIAFFCDDTHDYRKHVQTEFLISLLTSDLPIVLAD